MKKSGVKVSGFNKNAIGQQEVTISYKGKSTKLLVNVVEGFELGDINMDKEVNATDLLLMKRHIIAGDNTEWIITGEGFTHGDMNNDQSINATDLLLLKRKIINIMKEGE